MEGMEIFVRVFGGLTRLGPGSRESTLKALSLLPAPVGEGLVLDVGCGTGASTCVLAEALRRPIIASDVAADFLAMLGERVAALGLGDLVEIREESMDALSVAPDSAALIWSEGAVFTVGLERALTHWLPLLKPGGMVALSDLAWVGPQRPAEAVALFDACYDGLATMPDVGAMITTAERCGYRPEAHFVMPESDWWDEFYAGLTPRLEALRPEAAGDEALLGLIDRCEQEREVVRKYPQAFGYVFMILRKPL